MSGAVQSLGFTQGAQAPDPPPAPSQKPLTQSVAAAHTLPLSQPGQPPPQSTSVSGPFFRRSPQVAAWQTLSRQTGSCVGQSSSERHATQFPEPSQSLASGFVASPQAVPLGSSAKVHPSSSHARLRQSLSLPGQLDGSHGPAPPLPPPPGPDAAPPSPGMRVRSMFAAISHPTAHSTTLQASKTTGA